MTEYFDKPFSPPPAYHRSPTPAFGAQEAAGKNNLDPFTAASTPEPPTKAQQNNSEKDKKSDKKAKDNGGGGCAMTVRRLILRVVVGSIYAGVITLCLISAVYSIKKLIETSNTPSSTYRQKKNTGNHNAPGLIFISDYLIVQKCSRFNFTSLNIDDLNKEEFCVNESLSINENDNFDVPSYVPNIDIEEFKVTMPDFLKRVREPGNPTNLYVYLVRGPDNWMNKDTIMLHISLPIDQSGLWGVIHWEFEEVYAKMQDLQNPLGPIQKWDFIKELLTTYSMNFVSSGFRSFFLMSKQEFKYKNVIEAIRIDMEISLMKTNVTALDEAAGRSDMAHVEALYQWKDGYYMEGNQFLATSPWTIVTIVASALLMVERGYNTWKRFWVSSKAAPKKQPPPERPKTASHDANDTKLEEFSPKKKKPLGS